MSLSANSFERCCRLCAEEQEVTIMLFSEEAEAMLLTNKLNKYLLIEVDEDDKLPKNICVKCCSKLQLVCDFIDKAIKAQDILQKYSLTLNQTEEPAKTLEAVKTAPSSDDNDDEENYDDDGDDDCDDEDDADYVAEEDDDDDEDEDDDAIFTPMEISVDPMMVLQNSDDSLSPNTEENCETEEQDVTHLHSVDSEDVTIKLIKRGDKPDDPKTDGDSKPFPCFICDRSFHTDLALRGHLWVHNRNSHSTTKHEKSHNIPNLEILKQQTPKPYKCNSCGNKFDFKLDFVEHLKTHNTPGTCLLCGRRFRTMSNLATHMESHKSKTERAHLCKVCGRSYNTSSNLKTHSVTHSNERPYVCQYCNKCFKRSQDLKFHINQHTGEKPYKCPFCDKRFASSGNCYSHKSRMHPGRNIEGKRVIEVLNEGKNMQLESNINTGFMPEAKIKKIGAEAKHVLQFRPIAPKPNSPGVKGPVRYQCTMCEQSFLKREHFTYHMYKHTGEKPFHCMLCSEKFVTSRGLMIHHDRQHPLKDRPLAMLSRNALLK